MFSSEVILFFGAVGFSFAFALLSSKYLRRLLIKLQIPETNDEEMGYTLTTVEEVETPYLLIENTKLKFLSFSKSIRFVLFLVAFVSSLLCLLLVLSPSKTWINIYLIILAFAFLTLMIFPLLMYYFFLEVILNCDRTFESVILNLIPLIGLFGGALLVARNNDPLEQILLVILGAVFLPGILLSANFVAMNYPGLLVNTIQHLRRNWDYLVFQRRNKRLSKPLIIKNLLHGLFFIIPFPFMLTTNILFLISNLMMSLNIIRVPFSLPVQLIGIFGVFDVLIILAMTLSFFRYSCFTSAIDQISVDDPDGVIPQTAAVTLSHVVFLIFSFIGLSFYALTAIGYAPEHVWALLVWNLIGKIGWILVIIFYSSTAVFLFFWDFRIYSTECGIIVLTDNEWDLSLSIFPLFKLIRKNLGPATAIFEILKEKDMVMCGYCGQNRAHWQRSTRGFFCENCQNEW